ncbi:hypothetical protein KFE25_005953 [Diacronema lutheri]|uniref:BZIP domain-containing protein n=1 Tax=Diacronema lutheri TaxID=2081491 RepID=A0A8J5XQ28_DIALT|nr:hypothetical protein KFE25_005953 [Diacronema lutheri]|mmetsp:Transcript_5964/g.18720  ORF Transcript_5964/g.18720 Transcript_5964/m.18720 type:complete len:203 (-) Transcript_5964:240-848(-)
MANGARVDASWEEDEFGDATVTDVAVDEILVGGYDGELDLEQLSAYLVDDALGAAPPPPAPALADEPTGGERKGWTEDADDFDLPFEWTEQGLGIFDAKADDDDDGRGADTADHLARRRAKNRISARLCRERKKQNLSHLEVRLGSLSDVSRLLDEQLRVVMAQNCAMQKDVLGFGADDEAARRCAKRGKLDVAVALPAMLC